MKKLLYSILISLFCIISFNNSALGANYETKTVGKDHKMDFGSQFFGGMGSFVDKYGNSPFNKSGGTFSYKYDKRYTLQRDYANHGGRYWKLFFNGKRIGSYSKTGYRLAD